MEKLSHLIEAYNATNFIQDFVTRVSQKDQLSSEMAQHIVKNKISREELLKLKFSEGLIVAISSAVILSPEATDLEVVLKLASTPKTLHAKYKIVTAIGSIDKYHKIDLQHHPLITSLLDNYTVKADHFLLSNILKTKGQLGIEAA